MQGRDRQHCKYAGLHPSTLDNSEGTITPLQSRPTRRLALASSSTHCPPCEQAPGDYQPSSSEDHRFPLPPNARRPHALPRITHFRTSSQIPHHALLHTPSRTSSPHAPARSARAARDDDRNREHLPSRTCARPARPRRPFHRGNSRTARTHSHIAHAHSRMPPYRMGQTHSHMPPCRMGRTAHLSVSTEREYMPPCRVSRTNAHVRKCLNGASLQRFGLYMSENARMGPVFPSRLTATTTSELRKPRSKL